MQAKTRPPANESLRDMFVALIETWSRAVAGLECHVPSLAGAVR